MDLRNSRSQSTVGDFSLVKVNALVPFSALALLVAQLDGI